MIYHEAFNFGFTRRSGSATSLPILLFAGKLWKVTPLSLSFSVRFLQSGTVHNHDGIFRSQLNKQDRI